MAHKLGIESKLTENPTLCLGTSDVSVYEMVAAYCTFANAGYRVKPLTVLEIRDKNGNLLKSFFAENKLVINANTAYQMLYLMRGAVEDGGWNVTTAPDTVQTTGRRQRNCGQNRYDFQLFRWLVHGHDAESGVGLVGGW